jgi:hypothetical protein
MSVSVGWYVGVCVSLYRYRQIVMDINLDVFSKTHMQACLINPESRVPSPAGGTPTTKGPAYLYSTATTKLPTPPPHENPKYTQPD